MLSVLWGGFSQMGVAGIMKRREKGQKEGRGVSQNYVLEN